MTKDENDLCKTCKHYWLDFPIPLERYIPHCEILDRQSVNYKSMDDTVPYPCLSCPFESYKKND